MLDKIKTLKEIIEPKANKLGISFEEMLEDINCDTRFDIFYKHLLKIKEAKRLKWSTKLYYGFYDIDKIYKIYEDGYYSKLTMLQKNKIQKFSNSIVDNFFKESKPFTHYKTNFEVPCVFIDLLESNGLTYQGYNTNQYGRYPDEMIDNYIKTSEVYSNLKKLGKLDGKYIIDLENYDEYISILKEAGFLFLEPIKISKNEIGRDDRKVYYKKAEELFNSIITPWRPDASQKFNEDDAINWVNAHSVDLFNLILQQIKMLLVFKTKQKWNEGRWNIINYVDYNENRIHKFIVDLNITNNIDLKNNIDKINRLIEEIVNSFNSKKANKITNDIENQFKQKEQQQKEKWKWYDEARYHKELYFKQNNFNKYIAYPPDKDLKPSKILEKKYFMVLYGLETLKWFNNNPKYCKNYIETMMDVPGDRHCHILKCLEESSNISKKLKKYNEKKYLEIKKNIRVELDKFNSIIEPKS